jgi:methylenetetrahydrofolate dehydrogenase (NADP+)/methenyltetrahydrofolate cyclohydrolase
MNIIDGKAIAKKYLAKLKQSIKNLGQKRAPGLATILVGDDTASHVYVHNKQKAAQEIGMKNFYYHFPNDYPEEKLIELIGELNVRSDVDGILVQLPLPKSMNEAQVINALSYEKDVDGFHPMNLGLLMRGEKGIIACTPLGVMHLLDAIGYNVFKKYAVVVGKSVIVGKPMAHLLLEREATVTICHKNTDNIYHFTKQADVVVCAAGRPNLLTAEHIKPGAVVIDVGINRDENGHICGDVNFKEVLKVASYITPVPGGVGPMTIAMLLKNTFDNYKKFSS